MKVVFFFSELLITRSNKITQQSFMLSLIKLVFIFRRGKASTSGYLYYMHTLIIRLREGAKICLPVDELCGHWNCGLWEISKGNHRPSDVASTLLVLRRQKSFPNWLLVRKSRVIFNLTFLDKIDLKIKDVSLWPNGLPTTQLHPQYSQSVTLLHVRR